MGFTKAKVKDFYLLTTDVENIFINEYLPAASGDYVKVYLYGLLYAQTGTSSDCRRKRFDRRGTIGKTWVPSGASEAA